MPLIPLSTVMAPAFLGADWPNEGTCQFPPAAGCTGLIFEDVPEDEIEGMTNLAGFIFACGEEFEHDDILDLCACLVGRFRLAEAVRILMQQEAAYVFQGGDPRAHIDIFWMAHTAFVLLVSAEPASQSRVPPSVRHPEMEVTPCP